MRSRSSRLAALVAVLALTAVGATGLRAQNKATGTWTGAGGMSTYREAHTATLLQSGKVLVAGGVDNTDTQLATADLYDPPSNSWSSAGSMSMPRAGHTATLLNTGLVLVAGGCNGHQISGGTDCETTTAELYDPAGNSWSATGSLATKRSGHTATLLNNGKVLVVGGTYFVANQGTTWLASAELYDPTTGQWSSAGSMGVPRERHTATLLQDGRVLVTGGTSDEVTTLASTEIYNPTTNSWSFASPMNTPREWHTATLLTTGRVLIAAGYKRTTSGNYLASAEIYDPGSNAWSFAASLATDREKPQAVSVSGGKVLVVGGCDTDVSCPLASAELYDPSLNLWLNAGSMATPRWFFEATLLANGDVLATGGLSSGVSHTASAERYRAALPNPAISAVADGSELAFFGRSPTGELWYQETSGGSFAAGTGWVKLLGSGVASRPKAVAVGSTLYVFFRDTSNELHYFRRLNGTWSTEQSLFGLMAGAPTAAVDGAGNLLVGVLNSSGNVFINRMPAGSGSFAGWGSLSGVLSGQLDMVNYGGDVYLFGTNPGGALFYEKWSQSSASWGSWSGLGGVLSSSPAAAVIGSNLTVFGINFGGVLFYRTLSGGSWGSWFPLDGILSGDPAAAATSSQLIAFGTNPLGSLFDRRSPGGVGWLGWDPLSGVLASGPEAVTVGTQVYVFGINGAGNTWYRVWNGSSFGAWTNLGGVLATE